MEKALFLLVGLLTFQSVAGTIIYDGVVTERKSDPDVFVDDDEREILGVPFRVTEPPLEPAAAAFIPGLIINESDSGETESTTTEEDQEVIACAALAIGSTDLFSGAPPPLRKGHEKLRAILLFYFHAKLKPCEHKQAHQEHALAYAKAYNRIAAYLSKITFPRAQQILQIAIKHGWSDVVFELLTLFEQRLFGFPIDIKMLRLAIQNGQFQVAYQMLSRPALRRAFVISGEKLLVSDFPKMSVDEYTLLVLEELLVEIVDCDLMEDTDAADVARRLSRERVYTPVEQTVPQVIQPSETVTAVVEPTVTRVIQPNATPLFFDETPVLTAESPNPNIDKRSKSWSSSAFGAIGSKIAQALSNRKTKSLFNTRVGDKLKEKRKSLPDDDDDIIDGGK